MSFKPHEGKIEGGMWQKDEEKKRKQLQDDPKERRYTGNCKRKHYTAASGERGRRRKQLLSDCTESKNTGKTEGAMDLS